MPAISGDIVVLLHKEVESLVDEISGFLFNEPLETEPLFEKIAKLQGICLMLELSSSMNLLGELVKVIKFLDGKSMSPAVYQPELASILDVYPSIFKVLSQIKVDIPFLFMPELAVLRKLQGLPPLYEFQLLKNHQWPESGHFQGKTILNNESKKALKKLKQLYQMGLLDILRGKNEKKGAEILTKVASKLQLVFISPAEKKYWLLVECVTQCLASGQLAFNPVRMRLLAAVERQLKTLIDDGGKKVAYPLGLWRAYAILLSMVADKDQQSNDVCKWAGAPNFDFNDNEMSDIRYIIFEGADKNIDPFLDELSSKLGSLHSLLERVDSEGVLSASELSTYSAVIENLVELCASESLTQASERFRGHYDEISRHSGSSWEPGSNFLKATAHSILYLECLILHVREQGLILPGLLHKLDQLNVDDLVEKNLVSSSMSAVWSECLRKLLGIKTLLDEVSTELSGEEVSDELTNTFGEIEGAAILIDDGHVIDIINRCKNVVQKLFVESSEEKASRLSSFADAVVALEFYFSSNTRGEQSDFVLTIADDYLAILEAS